MYKSIKYIYALGLIFLTSISGYSAYNSFIKNEVNCNDDEQILKIINSTKNENRIMCLEKKHPLHDYLRNNENDTLKIKSLDNPN